MLTLTVEQAIDGLDDLIPHFARMVGSTENYDDLALETPDDLALTLIDGDLYSAGCIGKAIPCAMRVYFPGGYWQRGFDG